MQWISWSGRHPHRAYLLQVHEWFGELEAALPDEIARRLDSPGDGYADRGAVWTYLTTDQPFGNLTERLARGIRDLIAAYMEEVTAFEMRDNGRKCPHPCFPPPTCAS